MHYLQSKDKRILKNNSNPNFLNWLSKQFFAGEEADALDFNTKKLFWIRK